MKSAATSYSDFFKKNTGATDPTMTTPEDKKKDAIKRRLQKKRKMAPKAGKMREF